MAQHNKGKHGQQNQGQSQKQGQYGQTGQYGQKDRLTEGGHSRGGLPDQMRDPMGQPTQNQNQKNQTPGGKLDKRT